MSKKIKIFLCDQPIHKTTHILKEHWETDNRFELICDPYFNPFKAKWADITWIEWCEGSMIHASYRKSNNELCFKGLYNDFVDPSHRNPIDFNGDWLKTKLINRAIDIDVWYPQFHQVSWENVDSLTYIAKHIFEIMNSKMDFQKNFPNLKIKHIPLSVDTEKFTFRDRTKTHGKNIAFVNHLWGGKGIPLAIQIIRKLVDLSPDWKLFIVGDWCNEQWLQGYIRHIISEMDLKNNIIIQDRVPDVNIFLEEMDYTLSTSYKEAFSLITAEAMSKGLKPVIHNWMGAKDIWNPKWIWNTIDEAVNLFTEEYNSEEYREYVLRYDKKFEIENADNLIFELL